MDGYQILKRDISKLLTSRFLGAGNGNLPASCFPSVPGWKTAILGAIFSLGLCDMSAKLLSLTAGSTWDSLNAPYVDCSVINLVRAYLQASIILASKLQLLPLSGTSFPITLYVQKNLMPHPPSILQ